MPPSSDTKEAVRSSVAAVVAHFADRPPQSLNDADRLGAGGYGLSKYHLEALALPLSHISQAHVGKRVSLSAASKAKTFADLVKLVTNALP